MSVSNLHRATKNECTERAILTQNDGRGQKQRLNETEEKILSDAALDYQQKRKQLDLKCLSELKNRW